MVAIPPKPPTKTTQATTTPETYHQTPHHQTPQQTQATTRGRNRATEQPRGGFATIDPRHAGDTPQGSAYGSNSPHRAQASTRAPPSQPSTRRNVGTESRHKPQPHQSQPKAPPSQPKAPPSQSKSRTQNLPKRPEATPTHPTPNTPNTPNTHEEAPRPQPWRPYPAHSRRHVLLDARTDHDVGGLVLHDGGHLVDGSAQVVTTQFHRRFLDLDGGAAALEGDE